MAHPGMPKPVAVSTTKTALLTALKKLDEDKVAVARVLAMETDFRKRISSHVESLPVEDALFAKFHTNPFVLLFHTLHKKDWHILRHLADKVPKKDVAIRPEDKWYCTFKKDKVTVKVTVRIGTEWWNYLGGSNQTFLEMTCAMIRACVTPSDTEPEDYKF